MSSARGAHRAIPKNMIRKTKTTVSSAPEFHLLPDEICLAEAPYSLFEVHCVREGFHFFDWGSIDINIKCHIYLTDMRVRPLKSPLPPIPPLSLDADADNWLLDSISTAQERENDAVLNLH